MPTRIHHCPFLNRSDPRCSSHFSLDRLSDAFDQCAGAYGDCPTYRALLAERRQRRGEPIGPGTPSGPTTTAPRHADGSPIVPLTLTAAAGRAGRQTFGGSLGA